MSVKGVIYKYLSLSIINYFVIFYFKQLYFWVAAIDKIDCITFSIQLYVESVKKLKKCFLNIANSELCTCTVNFIQILYAHTRQAPSFPVFQNVNMATTSRLTSDVMVTYDVILLDPLHAFPSHSQYRTLTFKVPVLSIHGRSGLPRVAQDLTILESPSTLKNTMHKMPFKNTEI